MKKTLAILLALLMVFSLCACGASKDDSDSSSKNSKAVEKYVQENKEELLSAMETSFASSSGMTCTSSIEVEGDGFIISININELEDVEDSVKQQLQDTYDQMSAYFNTALEEMQKEVPELKYYKVRVCEKDGDLLALIHAK